MLCCLPLSLAKKLAKTGATLVLVDIEEEANKQTLNEIKWTGGNAFCFKCDISNFDDVAKMVEEVNIENFQLYIVSVLIL
jgi:NAD(P)-dependent dehydrogenase (short-subunit alcohol dehydrogenase family)